MNPFLFASLVAFLALLRCLLLSACRAWDSLVAAAQVHLAEVVRYRGCHLFTELSSLSCLKNSLFLFPIRIVEFFILDRVLQHNRTSSARINSVSRNLPKSNRHRDRDGRGTVLSSLFSLLK